MLVLEPLGKGSGASQGLLPLLPSFRLPGGSWKGGIWLVVAVLGLKALGKAIL